MKDFFSEAVHINSQDWLHLFSNSFMLRDDKKKK